MNEQPKDSSQVSSIKFCAFDRERECNVRCAAFRAQQYLGKEKKQLNSAEWYEDAYSDYCSRGQFFMDSKS